MELRLIAAASLVALVSQGCYRPMYAPPYSSQGYPVGSPYPGSIQTIPPGQQYVPGSNMPPSTYQPGGSSIPTPYGAPYNPGATGPSATNPVPTYPDAAQYQPPDISGGNPLGFAPAPGNGLMQTAGTAPMAVQPNQFAPTNAAPLVQPTYGEAEPTPATVTSDSFEGGNSPTVFN